jgi:hypothetical protein
MYSLGTKNLTKKKIISKGLLEIMFNSNLSKIYNYHLVKVSQKQVSHLTICPS